MEYQAYALIFKDTRRTLYVVQCLLAHIGAVVNPGNMDRCYENCLACMERVVTEAICAHPVAFRTEVPGHRKSGCDKAAG